MCSFDASIALWPGTQESRSYFFGFLSSSRAVILSVGSEMSPNVWRHFWLSQLRVGSTAGIWCVEARDVPEYPAVHGTASPTELACPR